MDSVREDGIVQTQPRLEAPPAGIAQARPRIGLLGVMQSLYDDMLPGIAERQAAYAREVAAALSEVADVEVAPPVKERADAERAMADLSARNLDGLLVVMLTYGPAMRVARLLAETPLPICLANIQPVPDVTTAWDMGDLTYNQGIHGAQDTANAMVRAGRPFHVVTDDWRSDPLRHPGARRARAAAGLPRGGPREGGARGGGDHALAVPEGRRVRLRDERHGRHPRRRARAHPHPRAAGRRDRAGRAAPQRRRRLRVGRARSAGRGGRALRGRPGAERGGARGPRAHAARTRAPPRRRRLRRVLHPLRRDRRRRALRAAAARRRLEPHGEGLRLRRGGRRAHRRADVGRHLAARHDAVHRDVRDGLPARRDPDEPHGKSIAYISVNCVAR